MDRSNWEPGNCDCCGMDLLWPPGLMNPNGDNFCDGCLQEG